MDTLRIRDFATGNMADLSALIKAFRRVSESSVLIGDGALQHFRTLAQHCSKDANLLASFFVSWGMAYVIIRSPAGNGDAVSIVNICHGVQWIMPNEGDGVSRLPALLFQDLASGVETAAIDRQPGQSIVVEITKSGLTFRLLPLEAVKTLTWSGA